MRRRDFLSLGGAAAVAAVGGARAQGALRRVGFVTPRAESDPQAEMFREAFRQGAAKQGWTERNFVTSYRYGADTPEVATAAVSALIAESPAILFVSTTPPTVAAARLTQSIPIVFAFTSGNTIGPMVQSYAHPGGNLTGFVNLPDDQVNGKNIDAVRELRPEATGIAVLLNPDAAPPGSVDSYRAFAAKLGIGLAVYAVRSSTEIDAAMRAIAADASLALVVHGDAFITSNRAAVVAATQRYRVVGVGGQLSYVREGGLATHSSDPAEAHRGGGEYVGLILSGAKAGDLPIQTLPVRLAVNLKAAKALGVTLPTALLARADEVIE